MLITVEINDSNLATEDIVELLQDVLDDEGIVGQVYLDEDHD